jgi:hypothetical protein
MAEPWKDIADSIISVVQERAEDFLDENEEAKNFLIERAKRLAQLVFEYKTATDPAVKKEKKDRMELVQSTIETELAALALKGSTEAKETFKEVVKTAFGVLIKVIPQIVAVL